MDRPSETFLARLTCTTEVALRAAFQIVGVEPDDPARWARIRADHGLRLADAIVLDTAIGHRAQALATFDHRLAHATLKCDIEVLG